MRHVISVLMANEAGALVRVAGMFSQRGFNIESLNVAPTEDSTVRSSNRGDSESVAAYAIGIVLVIISLMLLPLPSNNSK